MNHRELNRAGLMAAVSETPRLDELAEALAHKQGFSVEDARRAIADSLLESGVAIADAARRGSAFVTAFRVQHGLTMPVAERSPWQMDREEFDAAGFAIRRGPIEPGGAYFATPGASTYHDTGTEDEGVNRYDLSALRIANTDQHDVARAILTEALDEPGRSEAERERIHELLVDYRDGFGAIDYKACDELVLSWAARRLGWDGIRVWENDDVTHPSSVFVWAVDRVDVVAQNHRVAVLQAIRDGLPVRPEVRAEVELADPDVRFELARAVAHASAPVEQEIEATAGRIEAVFEALGVDDPAVRASLREEIVRDAETGRETGGLPAGVSLHARALGALYARRASGHTHAPTAGGTVEGVEQEIDRTFGAGAVKRLFSGTDFHLVATEDDLPPRLRHARLPVAGVYDNASKQTWLVAEWIAPGSVRPLLLHEIGVHYGLRRMLGDRADELIAQARMLADSGDAVAAAARAKVPPSTHPLNVDEEILSHMVGDLATMDHSLVTRAKAQFKAFLFRCGVDVSLTPPDMLMIAQGSLRHAMKENAGPRRTLLAQAKALTRRFVSALGAAAPRDRAPEAGAIADVAQLDARAVVRAAQRLGIPERAVVGVLSDDVELLRDRDRFVAPSNCMEPQPFPRHELGTPKIVYWQSDFSDAYVDFLTEFDPHDLVTSEPENGIRKHPTFARYVEMFRSGHEAPYIHVFKGATGQLVASNRRRTLAAQEADARLRGWHGVENHETGLPLKYRDIVHAYVEAVHELREQAAEASPSSDVCTGGLSRDLLFLRPVRTTAPQSKAFQNWFQDSAIQHPDGSPMVAYHGTGADFSVFSREHLGTTTQAKDASEGFFFAKDASVADEFAWKDGERGCIMPVYLSMQRPYVTDFVVRSSNGREFAAILQKARAEGFDGVAAFGEFLDKETSIFVVFEPEQIKSALGNNGAFDPGNPDIRFAHAGPSVGPLSALDEPRATLAYD